MKGLKLSDELIIKTAHPDIYKDLAVEKKLFDRRYHLFVLSLGIGILKNTSSKEKLHGDLVKLSQIKDDCRRAIEILYAIIYPEDEEHTHWTNLLKYADGGLELLLKDYHAQGTLDLPRWLDAANKQWPVRVKEFHLELE